jgi:hypothetical protein
VRVVLLLREMSGNLRGIFLHLGWLCGVIALAESNNGSIPGIVPLRLESKSMGNEQERPLARLRNTCWH